MTTVMTGPDAPPAPLLRLADALQALRPLAETGHPVHLPETAPAGTRALALQLAGGLGVPIAEQPGGALTDVVAAVLAPALADPSLTRYTPDAPELPATVAAVRGAYPEPIPVTVTDGVPLRAYAAGPDGALAVIIASACGMPAQLCRTWLEILGGDYRVVTWETRGMFPPLGGTADFDGLDHSLAAQSADLIAVMDHFDLTAAHVMGLCGGAVIAVGAAVAQPTRIRSLSLWHGDFSGSPGPTTEHQDNLKALMSMAGQSRTDAAAINAALLQTTRDETPTDMAHLVVYPYATDELYYRYCLLTSATMTTDVSDLLRQIDQPCLVVTSDDDRTAHPGGSRRAAELISGARLQVEPHGDHISVFGAPDRLRQLLIDFLAETQ